MTDTLIVQLYPSPELASGARQDSDDPSARWLHLTGETKTDSSNVNAGELAALLRQPPANCRWIVLVPGEYVLTTTVTLPKRRRSQALQALPFMLEDSVAGDIALEQLAAGSDNAAGDTLVGIARKERLQHWLQLFASAGVTPEVLIPDYLQLPVVADSWQVAICGDRALVRAPDSTGFSTELPSLSALLETGFGQIDKSPIKQIHYLVESGASLPLLADGWETSEQSVHNSLQQLASHCLTAPLNLLQNEFRVVSQSDWNWRPWLAAAILAVAAVGIELLGTGLETARFNLYNEELREEMLYLAEDALPDVRQIRDPQAELLIAWRQWEKKGRGNAGFLPLLDRVSIAINRQPVTVKAVHFRDGALTVALEGTSLQQMDVLRQQLEQQGLYASMLNATTDADSARSDLLIKTVPSRTGRAG